MSDAALQIAELRAALAAQTASAEAAPEQPVLRLEAEPAAEEVPAAMAS